MSVVFGNYQKAIFSVPSICHLTILNPAVHTRIFYKLALSQIKLGYEVSICGQDLQPIAYTKKQVKIYPIPKLSRLSIKRLFIPLKLFFLAYKIKANIYIIHTPELLWVGWTLKKIMGCKVIYDVHEDYEKNIRHAGYYSPWLRNALQWILRTNQRLFVPTYDAVSYAEICYDNILSVKDDRKYILRNTFSSNAIEGNPTVVPPQTPYLLFSGTIAAQWGIWESLTLWKNIRQERKIDFVLAGFTYDKMLLKSILEWVEVNDLQDEFNLIGGDLYTPYVDILYLLKHAYASLGLYHLEPYIKGKIPTKFYEAMAFNKPIIFTKDPFWDSLNEAWNFGISHDGKIPSKEMLETIDLFYEKDIQHESQLYSWEEDEKEMWKMLSMIDSN